MNELGTETRLCRMKEIDKRLTHGFCYVYIRGGHFLPLLVGYFYFPHIPDAEGGTIKLCPDITPAIVLVRFLPIRVPLEFMHEGAGEINFLSVCHSERDNRANFGMKRGVIAWKWLLVVRLLWLWWLRVWGRLLWGRGRRHVLRLGMRGGPLGGRTLRRW